ncbi:hypothetical protein HYDPIDRAFT_118021 [Hydnomerulius pinastri MD-312]|uniref:Heterokaryon incompatibility domain-containing protein n=1 Tax=Hydnomerulius pinastri MD-312 TaxID=994086 RepID=A0A0C9VQB1_9AGAM|nr:hypothetical protein HYDPIDRAFT_118021 [Hydnomerulius pinastri MD-312]
MPLILRESTHHHSRPIVQELLDTFRTHVFSVMPAHMLDVSDPMNPRLIGRDGVYSLLMGQLKRYPEETINAMIEKHRTDHGTTPPIAKAEVIKSIIEEIARYAIFSHRWLTVGEITFEELLHSRAPSDGPGFQKLREFCIKASELRCSLAWADTCCIDKSSSSELDEAIRSMFRWYRSAHVCVVHLAETTALSEMERDTWFTRGWTLQELLAPVRIKFFGTDWKQLGESDNDKCDAKITGHIVNRTNIPEEDLRDFTPRPDDVSRRMAWAANRVTTRVEDRAYSLIGIFDVNLIIAYGEGDRAFGRLMEVIYQKRPHHEVFLWEGRPGYDHASKALPASPESYLPFHRDDAEFKDVAAKKRFWKDWDGKFGDTSFALTNRGLSIKCFDVWVTLRSPPLKVGDDMWELTLCPWHTLEDDIEDIKALVDTETCSDFERTPPEFSAAIGVLDYLRVDSDRPTYVETMGRLVDGRDHFGWLLMCPMGHAGGWYKVMTYSTVRLRFKQVANETGRSIEGSLIHVYL